MSGAVPIGMVLDPRTVGYGTLDWHRAAAFEKHLEARFVTVFMDLVNDTNPDFTFKNQLFYDRMNQYKDSNQPFVQEQSDRFGFIMPNKSVEVALTKKDGVQSFELPEEFYDKWKRIRDWRFDRRLGT